MTVSRACHGPCSGKVLHAHGVDPSVKMHDADNVMLHGSEAGETPGADAGRDLVRREKVEPLHHCRHRDESWCSNLIIFSVISILLNSVYLH